MYEMRDTKTKIGMRGSKGSEKCLVVAVKLHVNVSGIALHR